MKDADRIARNCAHWNPSCFLQGVCARCGVPWQLMEVHPDHRCKAFRERSR